MGRDDVFSKISDNKMCIMFGVLSKLTTLSFWPYKSSRSELWFFVDVTINSLPVIYWGEILLLSCVLETIRTIDGLAAIR